MYEQRTDVIDFKVLQSAPPFKPAASTSANLKRMIFLMPRDYKR